VITSIQGIFRNGKVELLEPPPSSISESQVVITFLPKAHPVNLSERGIDPKQAGELRARLRAITEDWERPEMDLYDET
jgi:hypothetical protein